MEPHSQSPVGHQYGPPLSAMAAPYTPTGGHYGSIHHPDPSGQFYQQQCHNGHHQHQQHHQQHQHLPSGATDAAARVGAYQQQQFYDAGGFAAGGTPYTGWQPWPQWQQQQQQWTPPPFNLGSPLPGFVPVTSPPLPTPEDGLALQLADARAKAAEEAKRAAEAEAARLKAELALAQRVGHANCQNDHGNQQQPAAEGDEASGGGRATGGASPPPFRGIEADKLCPPNLSSAQLRSMITGIEETDNENWADSFEARVGRHPLAKALLSVPLERLARARAGAAVRWGGASAEQLCDTDEWLAETLLSCLDPEKTNVINFKSQLSKADMLSGRTLLSKYRAFHSAQLAGAKLALDKKFAASKPLKAGMSCADATKACNDLLTLFRRTSKHNPTDANCERLMLIHKLPTHTQKLQDKATELEEKLLDSDVTTDASLKSTTPWSLGQLITLIGLHLERQQKSNDPNANLSRVPGNPNGPPTSKPICKNCGAEGHESKDCSKLCPAVKEKNCPCCHGGKCIFLSSQKPSKIKNATGHVVSRNVFNRLIALHKKKFPEAWANAAEEETEEQHEGDTNPDASAAIASAAIASGTGGPRVNLQAHAGEFDNSVFDNDGYEQMELSPRSLQYILEGQNPPPKERKETLERPAKLKRAPDKDLAGRRSTDTYERNKAKRGARQSARAATRAAQEARVQALYDQAARAKREADEAAARLQREADEQRMAGVMARLSDAADHVQGFQGQPHQA